MSTFKQAFDGARAQARSKPKRVVMFVSIMAGVVLLTIFRGLPERYLIAIGMFCFLVLPLFTFWRYRGRS